MYKKKYQLGRYTGNMYRTAYAGAGALAYYAGRAMRKRIGLAARRYTGLSQTNRKYIRSGGGVTTQFDRRVIYQKKYMPRGRKRRWKSFVKKVNAVADKDLGSRTVVRNDSTNASYLMNTTNEITQNYLSIGLYGNETTGFEPLNDLRRMRADTDLGTTGKMIFTSGVFDMTLTNTSQRLEGSLNGSIRLEVDVYEITAGKEFGNVGTGATAKTLPAVFDEGSTDTSTIPGGTNSLTQTRRGWTPWDFPSAISEYRLKILKKTKYFLNEGDTFTYQIRDPKRHVVDRQKLNIDGSNMPGLTRFIYIVYKPVPGYTYDDTNPDTAKISVGVTRKYLYKINDKTQDYDVYNS